VLCISADRQRELLKQIPEMNAYFHMVFKTVYAAAQMKVRYLCVHFLEHFPDFTQRVPQYLLASFLSFTPEYLSEIRKKYLS
jgi:hypothetical protein